MYYDIYMVLQETYTTVQKFGVSTICFVFWKKLILLFSKNGKSDNKL